MEGTLLTLGVGCLVAAIVGQGLRLVGGQDIPALSGWPQRLAIALLGAALISAAAVVHDPDLVKKLLSPSQRPPGPVPNATPAQNPTLPPKPTPAADHSGRKAKDLPDSDSQKPPPPAPVPPPPAPWSRSFKVSFPRSDYDFAHVEQLYRQNVADAASLVTKSSGASVHIRSYDTDYGLPWSSPGAARRRAEVIEKALIDLGVPHAAITAESHGKDEGPALGLGRGLREVNIDVKGTGAPPSP